MNILVVDDEPVQMESLELGLRQKGYGVLKAFNGQEALNQLLTGGETIDLVITDYSMPGMNGMALLREIRKKCGNLPVIMITGYGEKEMIIDAMRNRCDSFLEKPFSLDQLVQEIERARVNMIRNTGSHELARVLPMLVHQLNNPLACIVGSAGLAMHALDNEEALRKCIQRIVAAADEISRINREVLKMGEPSDAACEKVDVNSLIHDCIHVFKDVITLKGVTVIRRMEAGPSCLRCNRFGLEQLFKNLILNAIDSMDGRPGKLLTISVAEDTASSSTCVTVEDTGCGIPEEHLSRIFLPDFTDKKQGTGLGLAVAQGVVEKHGGRIQVESKVGKGTKFTVSLPWDPPAGCGAPGT